MLIVLTRQAFPPAAASTLEAKGPAIASRDREGKLVIDLPPFGRFRKLTDFELAQIPENSLGAEFRIEREHIEEAQRSGSPSFLAATIGKFMISRPRDVFPILLRLDDAGELLSGHWLREGKDFS